jgi:class 3 adenylate cyclase
MDDKGTTLIGVFGLYPFSHENDPLLAIRCAVLMQRQLKDVDIQCSIGVTTGNVFSGAVGSSKRREFAVVGDVVNLSARLMVAGLKMNPSQIAAAYFGDKKPVDGARVPQPILCDADTFHLAKVGYVFRSLPPIKVKGKENLIEIYMPLRESYSQDKTAMEMVGRESLMMQMKAIYNSLSFESLSCHGTVCIIEGDVGKNEYVACL